MSKLIQGLFNVAERSRTVKFRVSKMAILPFWTAGFCAYGCRRMPNIFQIKVPRQVPRIRLFSLSENQPVRAFPKFHIVPNHEAAQQMLKLAGREDGN